MTMRYIGFLFSITLLASGCASHPDGSKGEPNVKLKVSLENKSPSYKDYFDSIEMIPLESNDSSLMAEIEKVVCIGDTIVAYDGSRNIINVFSPDGRFLNRIGNIGQGPEEYTLVYDISYNPGKNFLSLLSPFGEYLDFSIDNKFLQRTELPPQANYQSFEWISDNRLALWSSVPEDEPGMLILNTDSGNTEFEGWHQNRHIEFLQLKPFSLYNGTLFFSEPIGMSVLKLENDSLTYAYEWDFGKDNFDVEAYCREVADTDISEQGKKVKNDIHSGYLPYMILTSWQLDDHYLSILFSCKDGKRDFRTLIYKKSSGESSCISKFKEGMSLTPLYVNDEYLICSVPEDEIGIYNKICNQKIESDEDGNVILAKYYFQKR